MLRWELDSTGQSDCSLCQCWLSEPWSLIAWGLPLLLLLPLVSVAVNLPGFKYVVQADGAVVAAEPCPADTYSPGMRKQRACGEFCVSDVCDDTSATKAAAGWQLACAERVVCLLQLVAHKQRRQGHAFTGLVHCATLVCISVLVMLLSVCKPSALPNRFLNHGSHTADTPLDLR